MFKAVYSSKVRENPYNQLIAKRYFKPVGTVIVMGNTLLARAGIIGKIVITSTTGDRQLHLP